MSQDATQAARDLQRTLYGAPLSDLVGQVAAAFALSQAGVARVLGLSAPMMSQLVSGHRVKIGNPAAVRRLQALIALVPQAAQLSAEDLQARLTAIGDEQATITAVAATPPAVGAAVDAIRSLASAQEFARLADLTAAPRLAAFLREVAQGDGRG